MNFRDLIKRLDQIEESSVDEGVIDSFKKGYSTGQQAVPTVGKPLPTASANQSRPANGLNLNGINIKLLKSGMEAAIKANVLDARQLDTFKSVLQRNS